MLGKPPHPVIGRLSELLVSGGRAAVSAFPEVATSPRGPLDYKIQSPRGLKNYDLGGVGLGIVVALDKSSGGEILGKCTSCCPKSNKAASAAIPVKNRQRWIKNRWEVETDAENLENYTYVTCHGPNNKSFTKVYYDGLEYGTCNNKKSNHHHHLSVNVVDIPAYPTSDFLSCCHLCRKKLHGKDIYMYRGEKGFCSVECRSRQIMMDERKEQCRSELVQKSADAVSTSRSPIFSTGIVAI